MLTEGLPEISITAFVSTEPLQSKLRCYYRERAKAANSDII
jgi:hypothetical protein